MSTENQDPSDIIPEGPSKEFLQPATPVQQSAAMVYFGRLKRSVPMLAKKELNTDSYKNERFLAGIAHQYGDDIVTCSPEEAIKRVKSLRLGNYRKAMVELTAALEKRQTYSARLF